MTRSGLMRRVRRVLGAEPVMLGAAVLATVDVWNPSPVVHVAIGAWVALGQRLLSTPARRAEERSRKAAADAAHVADVEGYHRGVNTLAELARAQRRARR